MTKPKAKRAEGPFHRWYGDLNICGIRSENYNGEKAPALILNNVLADWLRTEEGCAWVKSVLGGKI